QPRFSEPLVAEPILRDLFRRAGRSSKASSSTRSARRIRTDFRQDAAPGRAGMAESGHFDGTRARRRADERVSCRPLALLSAVALVSTALLGLAGTAQTAAAAATATELVSVNT